MATCLKRKPHRSHPLTICLRGIIHFRPNIANGGIISPGPEPASFGDKSRLQRQRPLGAASASAFARYCWRWDSWDWVREGYSVGRGPGWRNCYVSSLRVVEYSGAAVLHRKDLATSIAVPGERQETRALAPDSDYSESCGHQPATMASVDPVQTYLGGVGPWMGERDCYQRDEASRA
jgi:hypothetical protein